MRLIPPIPSLYFSAHDHEVDINASKIIDSDSFGARVRLFRRCAKGVRRFLATAELSEERRKIYEDVACVLQFEDDSDEEIFDTSLGLVAVAVLKQHLLDCDVPDDVSKEVSAFLEQVMNIEDRNGYSMFQTLLERHADKEYSAAVFFMVRGMIGVGNAE